MGRWSNSGEELNKWQVANSLYIMMIIMIIISAMEGVIVHMYFEKLLQP